MIITKGKLFPLIHFLALILFSYSHITSAADRSALVIGNAAYPESPLANTTNDAHDVAIKLKEFDFKVTEKLNLPRKELARTITEFLRDLKGSDNVALFYYSGHGLQVDGVNYLIPIDAKIHDALDVPNEAVSVDHLLAGLNDRSDNAMNLIILDACRDNPFKQSDKKSLGQKGLARVNIPSKGTLVLYATKPGETASDNPQGRNGLFTQQLLKAMDQPGTQIEDVFKQVANDVFKASNKKQTPWMEGVIFGKFYLTPSSEPGASQDVPTHSHRPSPPPPPPPSMGYFQVTANVDNAEVKIEGKTIGKLTKDQLFNYPEGLPIGLTEVEVSAPGYDSIVRSIEIIPNKWTSLTIVLQKSMPVLNNSVDDRPHGPTIDYYNNVKYKQGNLYALIIGVSDYDRNDLDLESAANNAIEFSKAIRQHSKGLYESVHINTLTDPDHQMFVDGLDWLSSKLTTNENDTLIFYYSGHYMSDPDSGIYYLTKDADPDRLRRTAVSDYSIVQTILPFFGHKLIFFDTPHQAPGRHNPNSRGMYGVAEGYVAAGRKIVIFMSPDFNKIQNSSKIKNQYSFTNAVIDGINGEADYTQKGEISVNSLELYINERYKPFLSKALPEIVFKGDHIDKFIVSLVNK